MVDPELESSVDAFLQWYDLGFDDFERAVVD